MVLHKWKQRVCLKGSFFSLYEYLAVPWNIFFLTRYSFSPSFFHFCFSSQEIENLEWSQGNAFIVHQLFALSRNFVVLFYYKIIMLEILQVYIPRFCVLSMVPLILINKKKCFYNRNLLWVSTNSCQVSIQSFQILKKYLTGLIISVFWSEA